MRVGGVRAHDELGVVGDALLALVRRREIRLLAGRAERDVADRVVGVGLRIGLPHLDARLHELAHRRLEVVVANDPARDPGRAGAGCGLVQDENVPARTGAALSELEREVIRGGKTVNSGTHDDVGGSLRKLHAIASSAMAYQMTERG